MTEDLFLTFIDKKSLPFCDNILCKLTGYSAVQLDYTGLAVQVCCTYYLLNNNHVLYKTVCLEMWQYLISFSFVKFSFSVLKCNGEVHI